MFVWNISSSDEYDAWFNTLDEESKEAVFERVLLLRQFGPNLPRPYSDTLHGSKYKNLKDLVAESEAIIERHEKEMEK